MEKFLLFVSIGTFICSCWYSVHNILTKITDIEEYSGRIAIVGILSTCFWLGGTLLLMPARHATVALFAVALLVFVMFKFAVEHLNSPEEIAKQLAEDPVAQAEHQQAIRDAHLANFGPADEMVEKFVVWLAERCDEEDYMHPSPHIWALIRNVIREVYTDSFLRIYQTPSKRLNEALPNREAEPLVAYNLFTKHLGEALMIYIRALPATTGIFSAPLYDTMEDAHRTGAAMLRELHELNDKNYQPMPVLYNALDENHWRVTRRLLPARAVESGQRIYPNTYPGSTQEFILDYFLNTPFLPLFQVLAPLDISRKRLEHEFILAPSGTGKTQLLQWMIAEDIKKVLANEASLVVIDSQGVNRRETQRSTITENVISLKAIQDRLVYIKPDPNLQLNIFDTGYNDPNLDAEEREIRATAAREMVTTAMGAASDLQFHMLLWCTRLAMLTDNPSLGTLRRILATPEKEFPNVFGEVLRRPTATQATRDYFATFHAGARNQTKESLVTRVDGMRSNDIFSAMVDAPYNEFQMIDLVEANKVVVIDADKSRLGDHGAEAFGRFFVAQLLYASRQRQTTKPVYVYIDECHDFVSNDENVARLLTQARKQDVGMILACPNISLINSTKVRDTLNDVAIIAKATEHAPAGTFDVTIRGITKEEPSQIKVPYGVMEGMERISPEAFAQLRRPRPAPQTTPPRVVVETPPEDDNVV